MTYIYYLNSTSIETRILKFINSAAGRLGVYVITVMIKLNTFEHGRIQYSDYSKNSSCHIMLKLQYTCVLIISIVCQNEKKWK